MSNSNANSPQNLINDNAVADNIGFIVLNLVQSEHIDHLDDAIEGIYPLLLVFYSRQNSQGLDDYTNICCCHQGVHIGRDAAQERLGMQAVLDCVEGVERWVCVLLFQQEDFLQALVVGVEVQVLIDYRFDLLKPESFSHAFLFLEFSKTYFIFFSYSRDLAEKNQIIFSKETQLSRVQCLKSEHTYKTI